MFFRLTSRLAYAHAKTDKDGKPLGIVHRDVSLKNIMIAFEGDVKVTDFGIAKARGFLTDQEGEVVAGKADFMSPDRPNSRSPTNGPTCFPPGSSRAFTARQKHFQGASAEESRQRIMSMAIPDFRTLDTRIDDPLNGILQRCLARDLAQRYASADQLMYDLEYYIYHGGYGPTNETLGKFMRELFGQNVPAAPAARGGTDLMEHTIRIQPND